MLYMSCRDVIHCNNKVVEENTTHTKQIEDIQEAARWKPNDYAGGAMRDYGDHIGMEPWLVNDLFSHVLIELALGGDEYLDSKFKEILVYARLKYADEIEKLVEEIAEREQLETKKSLDKLSPHIRKLHEEHGKRLDQLYENQYKVAQQHHDRKMVLVREIKRLIMVSGGNPDVMGEHDRMVFEKLKSAGLLIQSATHCTLHEGKFWTLSLEDMLELTATYKVSSDPLFPDDKQSLE